MSEKNTQTQLPEYRGPESKKPIYTLFWKMPESMQHAWESITWKVNFNLGEFASLIRNEQLPPNQEKTSKELGTKNAMVDYYYTDKKTWEKRLLKEYIPQDTKIT